MSYDTPPLTQAPPVDQTIWPLHGLRGVAAMTVLVGHLASFPDAPSLGVMLFFVLSGFLMGHLYLHQRFSVAGVIRYGFARVGRVYPLFALVVCAAAVLAFGGLLNPFELGPGDQWRHLLLAGDGLTIWTISVEFQFYALFVPLWWLFGRVRHGAALLGLLALVAGIVAIGWQEEAGRIALWRYLHLFVGGLLLSLAARGRLNERHKERAGRALPLLLALYGFTFLLAPRFFDQELIYGDPFAIVLCLALVWCAVVGAASSCSSFLSSPPLVWLGEVSFGLYLLHRLVEAVLFAAAPATHAFLRFAPALALTFVLAWAAHRWIEAPARRAMRRWGEALARRIERMG